MQPPLISSMFQDLKCFKRSRHLDFLCRIYLIFLFCWFKILSSQANIFSTLALSNTLHPLSTFPFTSQSCTHPGNSHQAPPEWQAISQTPRGQGRLAHYPCHLGGHSLAAGYIRCQSGHRSFAWINQKKKKGVISKAKEKRELEEARVATGHSSPWEAPNKADRSQDQGYARIFERKE